MTGTTDHRQDAEPVDGATDDLCEFEEFRFRPESNRYDVGFDAATVPPSIAVVGAMSRLLARPPERLSALGRTVDLEALDALLGPDAERACVDARVTFDYYDRVVAVTQAGTLTVREPPADGVGDDDEGRAETTSG